MAKDCSFDIVSEYDKQELVNAIDQVKRDLSSRFDLKNSNSTVELEEDKQITVTTNDEMKLKNILDILQSKLVKRGLDIAVSVKFNDNVIKALSETGRNNVYERYGVIPIVSATNASLIKGKKMVDDLGTLSKEQLENLKGQEIIGMIVDKEAVNNKNNGLLDNIRSVIDEIKSINEMTPQRKFNKGLNAAMSTKFDYSVKDMQSLIDSGILSVDLDEAVSAVEKIRTLMSQGVFSRDTEVYLNYQLSKGNNEEVLGFIRGSLMNTLVSDISGILTIDEEAFQKDIKTNEVQAILILTLQAMMTGKTLEELYKTIEGSDELSARDYLNSIRNKLNEQLESILRENEYSIKKPAIGTAVDFRGIPELLMDDFKKAMSVREDVKISAIAVRSILSAA